MQQERIIYSIHKMFSKYVVLFSATVRFTF